MKISFSSAKSEDSEMIYSFNKEQIDLYEDINSIPYEKVLQWVKEKIKTNISSYVRIESQGNLIGFYYLHNEGDKTELDDLYILPQYRNLGAGTFVINKCLSEAKTPLFLFVFSDNTSAVALYEKLGFKITSIIKNKRYIMEK